jgi:hypothetical protein
VIDDLWQFCCRDGLDSANEFQEFEIIQVDEASSDFAVRFAAGNEKCEQFQMINTSIAPQAVDYRPNNRNRVNVGLDATPPKPCEHIR